MDTIFALLFVGQYFRVQGEEHLYRKVGERIAWAFRGYYMDQPVYVGQPGPFDIPFRQEEKVIPASPPPLRAARY